MALTAPTAETDDKTHFLDFRHLVVFFIAMMVSSRRVQTDLHVVIHQPNLQNSIEVQTDSSVSLTLKCL